MNFLGFRKKSTIDSPKEGKDTELSGKEGGRSDNASKGQARKLLSRLQSCSRASDIRESLNTLRSSLDLAEAINPPDIAFLFSVSNRFQDDDDIVLSVFRVLCTVVKNIKDGARLKLSEGERSARRLQLIKMIASEAPMLLDVIKNGNTEVQLCCVELLRCLVENDYSAVHKSFLSPEVCSMLVELPLRKNVQLHTESLQLLLALTTTDVELQFLFSTPSIFEKLLACIELTPGSDGPSDASDVFTITRNIIRQNEEGQNVFISSGSLRVISKFLEGVVAPLKKEWKAKGAQGLAAPTVGQEETSVTVLNVLTCLQLVNSFLDDGTPEKQKLTRRSFLSAGVFEHVAAIALSGVAMNDALRIAALRTLGNLLNNCEETVQTFLNLDVISVVGKERQMMIWSATRGLLENLLSDDSDPSLDATLYLFTSLLSVESCLERVTSCVFNGTASANCNNLKDSGKLFVEVLFGERSSPAAKYYAAHLLRMISTSLIGSNTILSIKLSHNVVPTSVRLPEKQKGKDMLFAEVFSTYTINMLQGGSRGLSSTTLSAYVAVLFLWMEMNAEAVNLLADAHKFRTLCQLANSESSVHVRFWCAALAASICTHANKDHVGLLQQFEKQVGGSIFFSNILFDVKASSLQWESPTVSGFACGKPVLYDRKFVEILQRSVETFKSVSSSHAGTVHDGFDIHKQTQHMSVADSPLSSGDRHTEELESLRAAVCALQQSLDEKEAQLLEKDANIARMVESNKHLTSQLEDFEMLKSHIEDLESTLRFLEKERSSLEDKCRLLSDKTNYVDQHIQNQVDPAPLYEEIRYLKQELERVSAERDEALMLAGELWSEQRTVIASNSGGPCPDPSNSAAAGWNPSQDQGFNQIVADYSTNQINDAPTNAAFTLPADNGVAVPLWVHWLCYETIIIIIVIVIIISSLSFELNHYFLTFLALLPRMSGHSDELPILGDCCISLHHSTTYEPPLYLFPELLPQVDTQGSQTEVWDGIADAVNVQKSFWRVANPLTLESASRNAGAPRCSAPNEELNESLASMITSNRLVTAGITTDILTHGRFSAEAITDQLDILANSAGFSGDEKTLIKSNHFINVLAWLKLRDINYPLDRKSEKKILSSGQKRPREELLEMPSASPTPWSSLVDDPCTAGRFISGMETSVEEKILLLEGLGTLYGKPVVSLCSRGQQTDHVVPSGTINVTSPYHELPSERRSQLDPHQDLQWTASGAVASPVYEVRVKTTSHDHQIVIPVSEKVFNVGREEGVISSRGGSFRVHLGLGSISSYPCRFSPCHFSIFIRSDKKDDIWFLNYGRNGVKLRGDKFLLSEPTKLTLPCNLTFTTYKLKLKKNNLLFNRDPLSLLCVGNQKHEKRKNALYYSSMFNLYIEKSIVSIMKVPKMMGFSIFSLLLATVFCANGLAILSETRFLPKLGLAPKPDFGHPAPVAQGLAFGSPTDQKPTSTTSMRITVFLQSVRMLLRWPLMLVNWIFIAVIVTLEEMSRYSVDKLPSLGSASKGIGRRKDKLGLWSAVALQQHFALSTSPQSGAIDVNILPQPQSHGRLTLAQKMGLVPPPPPEPTDVDWQQIETTASLRTDVKRMGDSCCSICLEPFNQTMNQGQIILSCSHVFHELCFKQFEKLTRHQQRGEGEYPPGILACPECRQTHYYKRCYYAGKALAQRHAIVKIQSAARGFLARRRYIKLRLRINSKFREEYIYQRLEKLSRAWEAYLEYRDKERERIMLSIDAKKQEAIAAYFTEGDWISIIERRITSDRLAQCEKQLGYLSTSERDTGGEFNECPICMERIKRRVQLHHPKHGNSGGLSANHGEEVVASFRREYEAKKRQKELNALKKQKEKKKIDPPQSAAYKGAKKRVNFSLEDPPVVPAQVTAPVAPDFPCYWDPPSRESAERSNVILSCGHCFHEPCLRTFENYSQWRTGENGYSAMLHILFDFHVGCYPLKNLYLFFFRATPQVSRISTAVACYFTVLLPIDYSKWDLIDDSDDSDLDSTGFVTKLDQPSRINIGPSGAVIDGTVSPFGKDFKRTEVVGSTELPGANHDDDLLILRKLCNNGGREGNSHFWSQTADTVTVSFILPQGVKGKDILSFKVYETGNTLTPLIRPTLEVSYKESSGRVEKISKVFHFPLNLDQELLEGCWELKTVASIRFLIVQLFKKQVGQGICVWWDRCFSTDTESIINTSAIEGRSGNAERFHEAWNEGHTFWSTLTLGRTRLCKLIWLRVKKATSEMIEKGRGRMKIFDQTISGTFYITFAGLVCGLLSSSLTSPITRVERGGKVLMGYLFVIAYDGLESNEPADCASHLLFLDRPCTSCRKTASLWDIPDGPRKRYMIAGMYFFGIAGVLCVAIMATSIVRIFLQESMRIRTTLRLMFLGVVLDVVFWFAMTAVIAAQTMDYSVADGFYDGKGFFPVESKVSHKIRVGFYLSLTTLLICIVSVGLVPWAAARFKTINLSHENYAYCKNIVPNDCFISFAVEVLFLRFPCLFCCGNHVVNRRLKESQPSFDFQPVKKATFDLFAPAPQVKKMSRKDKAKLRQEVETKKRTVKDSTSSSAVEPDHSLFSTVFSTEEAENEIAQLERKKKGKPQLLRHAIHKNEDEDKRTVFIGNIQNTTTRKEIKNIFKDCGAIESVRIRCQALEEPKDSEKKIGRGIRVLRGEVRKDTKATATAYVLFEERASVQRALEKNSLVVNGHHIVVTKLDAEDSAYPPETSIFLGNVAYDTTEEDIWNFFSLHGIHDVKRVRLVRDRDTGACKGFGYVEFLHASSVKKGIETRGDLLNGRELRIVHVNKSKCAKEATASRREVRKTQGINTVKRSRSENEVKDKRQRTESDKMPWMGMWMERETARILLQLRSETVDLNELAFLMMRLNNNYSC
eukprot:gene5303-3806_t